MPVIHSSHSITYISTWVGEVHLTVLLVHARVRARMQTAAGHRRYITLRNCRPDGPSILQRLLLAPRLVPAVARLLCGPLQLISRWSAWSLW